MSQFAAFLPRGKTVLLVANSPAPVDVAVPTYDGPAASQYHIYNSGSQVVWISYSPTPAASNAAQALAVIPTAGTSQPVFPVLPSASVVLTLPQGLTTSGLSFSGITGLASPTNVYITPGEGM